jgi:hypothetical protein
MKSCATLRPPHHRRSPLVRPPNHRPSPCGPARPHHPMDVPQIAIAKPGGYEFSGAVRTCPTAQEGRKNWPRA